MELQSVLTLVIESVLIGFAALVVFDFVNGLSALTLVNATPATEPAGLKVEVPAKLPDPWEGEFAPMTRMFQPAGFVFQLCLPAAQIEVEPAPDFSQMKLKELKVECAKRGITTVGNKAKTQTWLNALIAATR